MTSFYEEWLKTNDVETAFHNAQKTVFKKYSHPFYRGICYVQLIKINKKAVMKTFLILLTLLPCTLFGQYTVKSTMTAGKKQITTTNYIKGYVVLSSGQRKDGKISLKVVNTDTVEIRYQGNNKEKMKFKRLDLLDYGPANLLLSEVKNDYKDVSKNFHPGYIILKDGQKKTGKIASRKRDVKESDGTKVYGPIGVKYVGENDEVIEYRGKTFTVSYYMQNIGGEEQHYLNVYGTYIRVFNPRGRFSYYRNSRPTHVREGTTNLVKGVAESAQQELAESAAKGAAKRSFERSMKNGEDLGTAIGNATVNAQKAANEIQGAVNFDDAGGLYFKEYFIVDNKHNTQNLVYKKNIKEVLNTLLEGCGLDEKIVNKSSKIKELEEVMAFLEENACD
ncbi:hypothetical protein FNH22_14160 [Fulvivirga sp. M361]|uniref:hypothetical protein n=1 Tax=Fulvivirga sp. M361 TaxID=2594266 RepID=UPI00117BD4B0|nr:hypothetical protein [Fulvivirga sp. M361]TRX58203.1 hypothetical protein FNH22_14160 [Fulvivirga sp. M361]